MRIDTCALNLDLSRGAARQIAERVRLALLRLAPRIDDVTVRIEDVNAERGGVDKRCRLVIGVRRRGTVVVEAIDEDLGVAVGQALDRARTAVLRAIQRPRTRARRPQRRVLTETRLGAGLPA